MVTIRVYCQLEVQRSCLIDFFASSRISSVFSLALILHYFLSEPTHFSLWPLVGIEIFPSHEPAFFVSSTSTPLDFSALVREFSIRAEDSVFVDERAGMRVVVGDKVRESCLSIYSKESIIFEHFKIFIIIADSY